MWSSATVYLAFFALEFSNFSKAQDVAIDLCESSVFTNGYNASGSVSTDGFRINSTDPQSRWTWTRYVSNEYNATTNHTRLWQTFGLQTTPIQNLSDPALPYTGCILIPDTVALAGREDDGSCSNILLNGCVSELIRKVNATAARLSRSPSGSYPTFSCPELLENLIGDSSSACKGQFEGSISTQFLPRNFSGPAFPDECADVNPGNSDERESAFFAWGKPETQAEDFQYYDQAIRTPHPGIVAVWEKMPDEQESVWDGIGMDRADDNDENESENEQESIGWADVRVFCVPANQTEVGSRNITVAERAAGGGGRVTAWKGAILGVALLVTGLHVLF